MKTLKSNRLVLAAAAVIGLLAGAAFAAGGITDYVSNRSYSGYTVSLNNLTNLYAQCELRADNGAFYRFALGPYGSYSVRINHANATYVYHCG